MVSWSSRCAAVVVTIAEVIVPAEATQQIISKITLHIVFDVFLATKAVVTRPKLVVVKDGRALLEDQTYTGGGVARLNPFVPLKLRA